jgi:hypothetical protein
MTPRSFRSFSSIERFGSLRKETSLRVSAALDAYPALAARVVVPPRSARTTPATSFGSARSERTLSTVSFGGSGAAAGFAAGFAPAGASSGGAGGRLAAVGVVGVSIERPFVLGSWPEAARCSGPERAACRQRSPGSRGVAPAPPSAGRARVRAPTRLTPPPGHA